MYVCKSLDGTIQCMAYTACRLQAHVQQLLTWGGKLSVHTHTYHLNVTHVVKTIAIKTAIVERTKRGSPKHHHISYH